MNKHVAALAIALLCATSSLAAAKSIYVDDSPVTGTRDGTSWSRAFQHIQDAVNAAVAYDVIYIARGSYVENVVIDKSHLTLIGSSRDYSVMQSPASTGTMIGASPSYVDLEVRQLGFSGPGNGIQAYGQDTLIQDCAFTDTYEGVRIKYGRLEDSVFEDNLLAINAYGTGRAVIDSNTITGGRRGVASTSTLYSTNHYVGNNTFSGQTDYAIEFHHVSGSSYIYANHISTVFVGVYLDGASSHVFNNIFEHVEGDAVRVTGSSSYVVHNTFLDAGAAVKCFTLTWYDSSYVANNAVRDSGFGFAGDSGCQAQLETNAFYANMVDLSGTYIDLGGNITGSYFSFAADYSPATVHSPLINAGTWFANAAYGVDYWGRTRSNPPEIGAVEFHL